MRVLVLSDLHLGHPSLLPGADQALYSLLYGDEWDIVVFLGDLFEMWESTYFDIRERHNEILFAIQQLECGVVYVPGNHDDVFRGVGLLDGMEVATDTYAYQDGDKKVVMTHGHRYDETPGMLSRISYWFVTKLDTVACFLFGSGLSVTRQLRYSLAKSGRSGQYADTIRERAMADLDGDVVVLGHTHLPQMCQCGNRIYVNTGDFGPEHLSYVVIEDGVPDLRVWDVPT